MTKLLILRSGTKGNRPAGKSYGEPYVNFAENQFGIINSAGGAQDLLGVPIFSTTNTYSAGQPVNYGGQLYVALGAVAAGAFNPAQWTNYVLEAPNDGQFYGRQSKAWVPYHSSITAYWGGTLNITPLGQNVSSWTGSTTNVATFASPHGIATQALVILTGTVPGSMPVLANQPVYFGALSPTTGAFYNLLSDAKADINRISGGTTTAWSFKTVTYSNVVSSGFDANVPIGAKSATGNIQIELNLSKPLAGLFAITLMGNVGGLARSIDGGTGNAWMQGVTPTIVSTTLIGFYGNWAWAFVAGVPSGGGPPGSAQGSWTQQGNTAMVLNFVVMG